LTGNELAKIRAQAGLTQAQLADLVRVSQMTVWHWENQFAERDLRQAIKRNNYERLIEVLPLRPARR